ncbi:hypothetical protein GCM10011514_53000 [Emticicia aquatilis]|uniref:Uncharacterized protein n=2 Tax=Emticicia aquatilis TaxID=1537369 RepID=A0A916Z954_9BACT|nr:hypothetical protein GCM10011514_53000 [Emticicia aquatilis]
MAQDLISNSILKFGLDGYGLIVASNEKDSLYFIKITDKTKKLPVLLNYTTLKTSRDKLEGSLIVEFPFENYKIGLYFSNSNVEKEWVRPFYLSLYNLDLGKHNTFIDTEPPTSDDKMNLRLNMFHSLYYANTISNIRRFKIETGGVFERGFPLIYDNKVVGVIANSNYQNKTNIAEVIEISKIRDLLYSQNKGFIRCKYFELLEDNKKETPCEKEIREQKEVEKKLAEIKKRSKKEYRETKNYPIDYTFGGNLSTGMNLQPFTSGKITDDKSLFLNIILNPDNYDKWSMTISPQLGSTNIGGTFLYIGGNTTNSIGIKYLNAKSKTYSVSFLMERRYFLKSDYYFGLGFGYTPLLSSPIKFDYIRSDRSNVSFSESTKTNRFVNLISTRLSLMAWKFRADFHVNYYLNNIVNNTFSFDVAAINNLNQSYNISKFPFLEIKQNGFNYGISISYRLKGIWKAQ